MGRTIWTELTAFIIGIHVATIEDKTKEVFAKRRRPFYRRILQVNRGNWHCAGNAL